MPAQFRTDHGTLTVLLMLAMLPATAMAEDDYEPTRREQPPTVEFYKETVPASGDVLTVPERSELPPAPYRRMPTRGMSMAQVEREYGTPKDRHPATGKPPITRWDYEAFSVFFEYRTVLHSVRPDRPAEIHHKDQLVR
jgi:hypothetical protein